MSKRWFKYYTNKLKTLNNCSQSCSALFLLSEINFTYSHILTKMNSLSQNYLYCKFIVLSYGHYEVHTIFSLTQLFISINILIGCSCIDYCDLINRNDIQL